MNLRDEILAGLSAPNKTLPCKLFYDERGSALFERISELEAYYLTRTELAIMRHAAAEMVDLIGERVLFVEIGSGSSVKTRLLLDRLPSVAGYVPIDLSESALLDAAAKLRARYPSIPITPLVADFTSSFELPHVSAARVVVYFPGSTVGNFEPADARVFLGRMARLCGSAGALLIGVDLKKDPAVLHRAYNDPEGITAAFNLNVLTRLNREHGANFREDRFWHHALYDPIFGRIEMHLVSAEEQQVTVGGLAFALSEGEPITTEHSYKYSLREFRGMCVDAGFGAGRVWTDADRRFAVLYLPVRAT